MRDFTDPRAVRLARAHQVLDAFAPGRVGHRYAAGFQRYQGFAGGVGVGLQAGQLRPAAVGPLQGAQFAHGQGTFVLGCAGPRQPHQAERVILGGGGRGAEQPRLRPGGAPGQFGAQFSRQVQLDGAQRGGGAGELAVILRRPVVDGQPLPFGALRAGNQACLDRGGQAGLHTRVVGQNQSPRFRHCRVDDQGVLHRAVHRGEIAPFGQGLHGGRAQGGFIHRDAALARQRHGSRRQLGVMAGKAILNLGEAVGRLLQECQGLRRRRANLLRRRALGKGSGNGQDDGKPLHFPPPMGGDPKSRRRVAGKYTGPRGAISEGGA